MDDLLHDIARRSTDYLNGLESRPVFPPVEAIERLAALDTPLPDQGLSAAEVAALLDEVVGPATVASAGPRYFGFVTGGSLPAALATNWLAGAWDQNAAFAVMSPAAAALEQVALRWVLDALNLPAGAAAGFVSGATMANFTGLAAARHALLERLGWDVEARGLFGAPELKVVVGDEAHASLMKALSLVGLGRDRVTRAPVDGQGRMRPDALPPLDSATIVCIQAGNVNTGAFDPAAAVCAVAQEAGAWVHVDGAFGLWAAACPSRARLAAGFELADSWAMDAHKWLNVPYDSGLAICRHPAALRGAMTVNAPYLAPGDQREPCHYTPEMSRRARGIEVWAALRSLGRAGLAELIERNCRQAARFAEALAEAGHTVHNEVRLNQVLVSFGDAEATRRLIAAVQAEGTCWCGGTTWRGHAAMRISVSGWATRDEDVERSIAAILRAAKGAA
jgi:glutamate/tyrosine decarboxylase-like PLP-dependent enzyme